MIDTRNRHITYGTLQSKKIIELMMSKHLVKRVIPSRTWFSFSLILVFLTLQNVLLAQAEDDYVEDKPMEEKAGGIVVSMSPSFTWVPQGAALDNRNEEGHFVPGMGVDFFYRLSPKWEIGTMIDVEFDHYLIPRKEELERERAFILTAMGAYTINPNFNVFAGVGVEFERHENFAVFRAGVEYAYLLNDGWFIPAGVFVDVKPGFEAWSLMIGVGKNFFKE